MIEINILIVDDESGIRDIIKEFLNAEGFTAFEAANGIQALEILEKVEISAAVIDVMMPYMDGLTLTKELRKTSSVPVIMLTARGEEYDKLLGFELGVDDYIVKPFSPKELMARIKAVVKRTVKEVRNLTYGPLRIETQSRNVYVGSELVSLTPKEFDLLLFLASNPGIVFSRDKLLENVWGYDFGGDDRTVDTHIKMVRERLGSLRKYIITVWSVGYKFDPGHKS